MTKIFCGATETSANCTGIALVASAIALAGLAAMPSISRADTGEDTSVQSATAAPASPYLSDWLHQSLGVVGSKDIRFGPYKVDDLYPEYEYWGRRGPFDLYGYVDVPRAFGVGNSHDSGYTNKGSPLFTEQEPRVSIDHLVGHNLAIGPVKEWYVAFDWIYDQGHNTASRQNTLYAGLGTDLAAPGKLYLAANFYLRRQFENYGAPNANSFDGYRLQMKWGYPLGTYWGGQLSYFGFFNYDFGSNLSEKTQGMRSDDAFVATNVLNYEFKHLRFWTAARYFHNGGQWAGGTLNFGNGPFTNHSTGWGWYAYVGYRF